MIIKQFSDSELSTLLESLFILKIKLIKYFEDIET